MSMRLSITVPATWNPSPWPRVRFIRLCRRCVTRIRCSELPAMQCRALSNRYGCFQRLAVAAPRKLRSLSWSNRSSHAVETVAGAQAQSTGSAATTTRMTPARHTDLSKLCPSHDSFRHTEGKRFCRHRLWDQGQGKGPAAQQHDAHPHGP